MASNFEIKRRHYGDNISLTVNDELPRGTAMQRDDSDPEAAAPANGRFVGFLVRAVQSGSQEVADFVFPNRQEGPYELYGKGSVEKAEAVECEGADYILIGSGTGEINENTALGTELSFGDGKFKEKENGETAYFTLEGILAAEDDTNDFRILVEAIR